MSQGQYRQKPRPRNTSGGGGHIYSQTGDVRRKQPSAPRKRKKPRGKIGLLLERIPYAAGVALCVLILCVSLVAGNARALTSATAEAMDAWQVSDYVSGRVGEARNLLKLCERNDISQELINALTDATDSLSTARGVSATMQANQALETAASNTSAALLERNLSASDERSLSHVMDEFREQGNFLRQQAREYNELAQEALELYHKLPTRFLLSAPEIANIG